MTRRDIRAFVKVFEDGHFHPSQRRVTVAPSAAATDRPQLACDAQRSNDTPHQVNPPYGYIRKRNSLATNGTKDATKKAPCGRACFSSIGDPISMPVT
ncbi:MAG: hypothetical protein N2439_16860 [Anaerolineae bacterium]|nr:hypothetical protein [Anaerolineae bacterium]